MSRKERILSLLSLSEGLTDREITNRIDGSEKPQQPVNRLCNDLSNAGVIIRRKRSDGKLGNYLSKNIEHKSAFIEKTNKTNPKILSVSKVSVDSHSLKELSDLGFEKVGGWSLQNGELQFHLENSAQESKILYAFVVDGVVKYIGKSQQTLRKRINLYKNGDHSQKTNIRVRKKITEALLNKNIVSIYVFINKIPLYYSDMEIDLAAGLESGMIAKFNPEWNIQK